MNKIVAGFLFCIIKMSHLPKILGSLLSTLTLV